MQSKNYYDDLCNRIFLIRLDITNLKISLDRVVKQSGPKPVKAQSYEIKTGGTKPNNVNDLYILIEELSREIHLKKQELSPLIEQRKQVESQFLLTLNSTERTIFLLKRKNYKAGDIAEKVGREEKTIWNTLSKINKKLTKWANNL